MALREFVGLNWDKFDIYAESVPHLLHQDLSFLLVLERAPEFRPQGWRGRLDAWRYLLGNFLLGKLEVEKQALSEPLLSIARLAGVEEVAWLKLPGQPQPIGVMSPAVLVRPLPDFSPEHLADWRLSLPEPSASHPDELKALARLACKRLREEASSASAFAARLAAILDKEFPGEGVLESGDICEVRLLKTFKWSEPRLASVRLITKGEGVPAVYVPRCQSCEKPLTRSLDAPAVDVESDVVQLACSAPGCAATQRVSLNRFLVWLRNSGSAVIWSVRGAPVPLAGRYAPTPRIDGNTLVFEWNPAAVDGSPDRRFLRFSFPGRVLRITNIGDAFYKKLLVPGEPRAFAGLPIRPEWIDALVDGNARAEVDPANAVHFRALRLNGFEDAVQWTYVRSTLRFEEKLGFGVFPDPRGVAPTWKWFRFFASGEPRSDVRLRPVGDPWSEILPWLAETRPSLARPSFISAEIGSDTGVTFPVPAMTPTQSSPPSKARLGIDFGTSHTIIYHETAGMGNEAPRPETHALKPADIPSSVCWLAAAPGSRDGMPIGDCLPGAAYRLNRRDPYLFPSAVWTQPGGGERALIRWTAEPPASGWQALSNFKLDREGLNYGRLRRAFLRELLLMSLAETSRRTRQRGGGLLGGAELGFAFPLALGFAEREGFRTVLHEVAREASELTGIQIGPPIALSESAACVRAFGMLDLGETCLVADMGGGTMDLALFTQRHDAPEFHFVGSVRFAGEAYISAVAHRLAAAGNWEEAAWLLRDALFEQTALEQFGGRREPITVLRRLTHFAFEFLRTLIAAFRQGASAEEATKPIKLILVGNGWSLVPAFDEMAERLGPVTILRDHYRAMSEAIRQGPVDLFWGRLLDLLPSSKHLVAIGALQNALRGVDMLSQEVQASRMPAGRALVFGDRQEVVAALTWADPVGESLHVAASRGALDRTGLRFGLHEGPPLAPEWQSQLLSAFGISALSEIPYPDAERLREQVLKEIAGDPPRLAKGPLQIILETTWRDWLGH